MGLDFEENRAVAAKPIELFHYFEEYGCKVTRAYGGIWSWQILFWK